MEINFSLIKVRVRNVTCTALERTTALLSGTLITKAVVLTWLSLVKTIFGGLGEQRISAQEIAADGDYICIL